MNGRWAQSVEAEERNHRLFLESGESVIHGDLPSDPAVLEAALRDSSLDPIPLSTPPTGFKDYLDQAAPIYVQSGYKAKLKDVFLEKAYEHYVSLLLAPRLSPPLEGLGRGGGRIPVPGNRQGSARQRCHRQRPQLPAGSEHSPIWSHPTRLRCLLLASTRLEP